MSKSLFYDRRLGNGSSRFVKELVKRGHDLGNHSEHHYDMTTISQSEKESELKVYMTELRN